MAEREVVQWCPRCGVHGNRIAAALETTVESGQGAELQRPVSQADANPAGCGLLRSEPRGRVFVRVFHRAWSGEEHCVVAQIDDAGLQDREDVGPLEVAPDVPIVRIFAHRRIVVAGDDVDWHLRGLEGGHDCGELAQCGRRTFELVAGDEHEVDALSVGQLDDTANRLRPLGTHGLGLRAGLVGLHTDLPICRVQESHGHHPSTAGRHPLGEPLRYYGVMHLNYRVGHRVHWRYLRRRVRGGTVQVTLAYGLVDAQAPLERLVAMHLALAMPTRPASAPPMPSAREALARRGRPLGWRLRTYTSLGRRGTGA